MHYFDKDAAQADKQHTITYDVQWKQTDIVSCQWLFSSKKIDRGTEILIKTLEEQQRNNKNIFHILDIWCGYGPLTIRALLSFPDAHVTAIDPNSVATDFTLTNIEKIVQNKKEKTEKKKERSDRYDVLTQSDLHSITKQFDLIITNPPFSAGKQLCFWLYQQAYDRLAPWWQLRSVVPTKKWAKSHGQYFSELFGTMSYKGLESGYRVIVGEK